VRSRNRITQTKAQPSIPNVVDARPNGGRSLCKPAWLSGIFDVAGERQVATRLSSRPGAPARE
jgi:hypothetical protein